MPDRAMDLGPRAGEDAAVDGEPDRRAWIDEALDQEVEQAQAELPRRPARAGEEVVGAGVVKAPREPRRLPHPADGALAGPPDETGEERLEDLKAGRREGRTEQGQDRGERRWQDGHRR